ncbi:P-loop containing nucleoside triphosphate hydrolase protein [Gonapodya prolifera JEL478]|uniref:Ribosome assembly protein 1 n=1 Tax=Gonapodya prolifera (strain JEL478) TaxID=1344416 RepID=A0A139AWQ3_GONPJ|nr:P-loop containing nucleoside triphosphate hydrolase protein [Gonapodya prolifera JEL478]|eukprot:KXS21129.1 P-loop containing nucleoside triphosphate hydrolase protein [Gonapodya prolifera JEL478]
MSGSILENLQRLQRDQTQIRNICILAHVDHGKTTLSDRLIATNGIISTKLAGKIRYLDSREDEQIRGITMKSSGISLYFKVVSGGAAQQTQAQRAQDAADGGAASPPGQSPTSDLNTPHPTARDYIINLIDSPGHVDFSSEVSTASRLCDGALVLVDVVEGVQTQTYTVLRQAWEENLRPILVLNKIDRLVTELRMTTMEAHARLAQIVERVNAIVGGLFAGEKQKKINRMAEGDQTSPVAEGRDRVPVEGQESRSAKENMDDEYVEDEEEEDADLYFAPEQGNVIFASAGDGWAFRLSHFAHLYATRLKINERHLLRHLWGDYYLDPKSRRVLATKHLKGRQLKTMFAQFVLDNIWAIYEAVMISHDRERITKIATSLGLKLLPRDLSSKDHRSLVQTMFLQWLPLSSAVLLAAVELVPDPRTAQRLRMAGILGMITGSTNTALMSYGMKGREVEFPPLPDDTSQVERSICDCKDGADVPVVAYVSKMFHVPKNLIVEGKQAVDAAADLRERRREVARRREMEQRAESGDASYVEDPLATKTTTEPQEDAVIAFARVFSGTLRPGQEIYVLSPKYDPRKPNTSHYVRVTISALYLMMGRELQELDSVPAGNICGIAGLEGHVIKTATLSSSLDCPSFGQLKIAAQPILRVAVEPAVPGKDSMAKLEEGLKMLNQSDPVIEVVVQETGENVIVAAGELHLERCLKDLRERYARIPIRASAPIVPFRETISNQPAVQYGIQSTRDEATGQGMDEAKLDERTSSGNDIDDIPLTRRGPHVEREPTAPLPQGTVLTSSSNRQFFVRVRCVPLPQNVTDFLAENGSSIRAVVEGRSTRRAKSHTDRDSTGKDNLDEISAEFMKSLRKEWWDAYKNSSISVEYGEEAWMSLVDSLWSFGPRKWGSNMLVNGVKGFRRPPWGATSNSAANGKRSKATPVTETDVSSPLSEPHLASQNNFTSVAHPKVEIVDTEVALSEVPASESSFDPAIEIASGDVDRSQDALNRNDARVFEGNIETGFQLATLNGPLCAEPLTGCCFILEEVKVLSPDKDGEENPTQKTSLAGHVISTVKEACRSSFLQWSPRLALAMYSCEIQADAEVLGKVYAVIAKRRGRILSEELQEGTSSELFTIKAVLPIVESFGFADDLRKRTSGAANPQLIFSGYEVLDQDPFWVPTTEEELEDLGEKADRENLARRYMDSVRSRKGMFVERKIVANPDKQKTHKQK